MKNANQTQSCKSPNGWFKQDCLKKNNIKLHNSFKHNKKDNNQHILVVLNVAAGMPTLTPNADYLKIVPVLLTNCGLWDRPNNFKHYQQ